MTLPAWISVDAPNNQLVGMAGVFSGATKSDANASAQAALVAFGDTAIASGNLECLTACADWSTLTWGTPLVLVVGSAVASFIPDSIASDSFSSSSSAPNPLGGDAALGYNVATLSYNGAACNCNLHVDLTNSGDTTCTCAQINIDWVTGTAFNDLYGLATGSYDFPFSLPDTGGSPITVTVTAFTQVPCVGSPIGAVAISFSGQITNV